MSHLFVLGGQSIGASASASILPMNIQGIWLGRSVEFNYRTFTGLGKQTFGGHKQNLMCTRTQEKKAVTPQETEPGLPVSVWEPG